MRLCRNLASVIPTGGTVYKSALFLFLVSQAAFALRIGELTEVTQSDLLRLESLAGSYAPVNAGHASRNLSANLDWDEVGDTLKGEGLVGEVHGSAAQYNQFVMTVRDPNDFFRSTHLSLAAMDPKLIATLAETRRHDRIRVWGEIKNPKNPQRHIMLTDVKIEKAHTPAHPAYAHKTQLPSELLAQTELVGKVHAVAEQGKILVVEYGDAVVPVFVLDPDQTKALYRNDTIRLKYKVRPHPKLPTHLMLDLQQKPAVEVLENIKKIDGKPKTVTGSIVYFPKSPQLLFEVLAVQGNDAHGIKREYTIINFDDADVFADIRKKLKSIWNLKHTEAVYERNKWVNPGLQIEVTGKGHVVSEGQANPQILVEGPDSIRLVN